MIPESTQLDLFLQSFLCQERSGLPISGHINYFIQEPLWNQALKSSFSNHCNLTFTIPLLWGFIVSVVPTSWSTRKVVRLQGCPTPLSEPQRSEKPVIALSSQHYHVSWLEIPDTLLLYFIFDFKAPETDQWKRGTLPQHLACFASNAPPRILFLHWHLGLIRRTVRCFFKESLQTNIKSTLSSWWSLRLLYCFLLFLRMEFRSSLHRHLNNTY